MSGNNNHYRVDLRDIRFVLFEQFELGKLLGHGAFADWGEEEADAVLREAQRFATEVAGPLNGVGDREGCQLVDGHVRTPPGFKEAYHQLYEGGLKSIVADSEYGGAAGPKALAVIVNELTSGPNAALDMYGGLNVGAAEMLYEFGTPEQRARYCEKIFSGHWAGTMCLTEPQAGSDVGECTTTATPLPDGGYSIKGSKIFISGGDQDITENIVHMVLARIEGAQKGTRGLSLFIVPKLTEDGSPNAVSVGSIEHKMGLNGSATCVLNFGDDGPCVGELMGGEANQGMRQMFKMMNFARIGVGVQGLGAAGTAYLNALAYARDRLQGSSIENSRDPEAPRVPILKHADIRRMLLEMKAKVEGIRAMIVKAAWHHDAAAQTEDEKLRRYHHGQTELLTPLVKAYASDQGFRIAEMAIQIYGGAGYTKDHPVEQYCRDAKVFSIYEGTNHIQALDLVGRKLGLDDGAHARAFFADIERFVKEHARDAVLGDSLGKLGQAAAALGQTALDFAKWSRSDDLARVPLVATPFLELMSETCAGWLLLSAATIASSKLAELDGDAPDAAFYRGKIASARHYAHWIVATVPARAGVLREAPATALEIDDEEFATN
jgi:alkylation response protein AidB-like acyl-CoA dehydrogenase